MTPDKAKKILSSKEKKLLVKDRKFTIEKMVEVVDVLKITKELYGILIVSLPEFEFTYWFEIGEAIIDKQPDVEIRAYAVRRQTFLENKELDIETIKKDIYDYENIPFETTEKNMEQFLEKVEKKIRTQKINKL